VAAKKIQKPTIFDVARLANVSTGTVSNVLTGSVPVSEARRTRVLDAIAKLGFTRNVLAQWLPSKTTGLIGVCVPRARLTLFSVLTETFARLAKAHHYETLQVLSPVSPEEELEQVKSMMKYRIGGLVLLPSVRPEATLIYLQNAALPTVIIDRPVPENFAFDQVSVDNAGVMSNLLRALAERGHRQILFVFRDRTNIVTLQRMKGIADARKHLAISVDSIASGDDPTDFVEIFQRSWETFKPTAVIASTSYIAEAAVRAFRTLRLNVPQDVSLVALDEPAWADIVEPPLSVVRPPAEEIARLALDYLMERMDGGTQAPRRKVLPAEIILRDSVKTVAKSNVARTARSAGKGAARSTI
jgi:LacI family transcriptional regulator